LQGRHCRPALPSSQPRSGLVKRKGCNRPQKGDFTARQSFASCLNACGMRNMSRYLDPKADVSFKKIFGDHPNLLKNFLNALLPLSPEEQIVSIQSLPTEQIPQIPLFKHSIVDVKCTDATGRIFIVEMQVDWTLGFMQRLLFGTAQAYVNQLYKGEDYHSLCPVYGIGVINDKFDASDEWYHYYKIVNVQFPEKQLQGLEFLFLELPKFKPSNREQKRLQVLWLRFLSEVNERTKEIDPELLAVPEIEEACLLCEQAAYSDAELEVYNRYWDHVSTAKTRDTGKKMEGRIEGEAIGEQRGRIEGEAIGEKRMRLAIAKQLLARGESTRAIAQITGLSIPEIETLQEYEPSR
jgi:predicted transposase/invertase (TIGR01784 family)